MALTRNHLTHPSAILTLRPNGARPADSRAASTEQPHDTRGQKCSRDTPRASQAASHGAAEPRCPRQKKYRDLPRRGAQSPEGGFHANETLKGARSPRRRVRNQQSPKKSRSVWPNPTRDAGIEAGC